MRPALRTLLAPIAGNVRRLRTDRGLTQERLAEAADIDLSFLQQIERAEVNLSMAILVAIAEALTVAPAELLQPAEMPAIRRGRPPKKKEAGEGGGEEARVENAPGTVAAGRTRAAPPGKRGTMMADNAQQKDADCCDGHRETDRRARARGGNHAAADRGRRGGS